MLESDCSLIAIQELFELEPIHHLEVRGGASRLHDLDLPLGVEVFYLERTAPFVREGGCTSFPGKGHGRFIRAKRQDSCCSFRVVSERLVALVA